MDDIGAAVRLWMDDVHRPERRLWDDYEWGNAHWYCCGDPLEARVLLGAVMQAMSPRTARELRRIVHRSDAGWDGLSDEGLRRVLTGASVFDAAGILWAPRTKRAWVPKSRQGQGAGRR
ncbi:hypothetical protein ABZO31_33460 [Streptomyces sp. HUAS MG47]|uniref:hypothetical protein n=1 Tax=Streptomyces solicamelliae TaxID=3231716 RepID=UPI003877C645